MRGISHAYILPALFLSAGSAMGQSAVTQQNNTVNQVPAGMQRYDQRWQNVGSGYSSLGLESMPHALDLRFPQSTGVTRPNYGYRPETLHTYVPSSSISRSPLQDRFALPRTLQSASGFHQPTTGQTRYMVDYAAPAVVPQQGRSGSPVIEPMSPIQINPVSPAEPLDRSLTPYRQTATVGSGSQVLQLPRLPWEGPAEPAPATAAPQTGTKPLLHKPSSALLRSGEDRFRLLPGGTESPLDLILQGGFKRSVEPQAEAAGGNLLRPVTTPPEAAGPSAAGSDQAQAPIVTAVAHQPEIATAATLNAAAGKHLENAQAHLKAGEYAKAATSYDLARVVAPKSPVPLLGRAVAQLATRDYSSSANSLLLAVELSPDPATFRQDFNSLLPDVAMVQERIRELQADLARFDDFRLRFLLGYAEYCSGDETTGMTNMTQAVHKMPPERAAARRLLEALRKDQWNRSATTTAPATGQ
ncbi:MAG: tetratricopeptide repeat protein [Phycisphaerae bacterium]